MLIVHFIVIKIILKAGNINLNQTNKKAFDLPFLIYYL